MKRFLQPAKSRKLSGVAEQSAPADGVGKGKGDFGPQATLAIKEESAAEEEREPTREELLGEESAAAFPDENVTLWKAAERAGSRDLRSAFTMYLREIGEVKLLTRSEEISLAGKVQKGDRKAREQMIKANLRLVVKIARDYEDFGVPLLDLISEGNMGLMKAVERFDTTKGAKLSTYAAWWIKQSIKRALANQSKTIRLPVHMVDKISKMRRSALRLHEELGREPTDEELAGELGTSARQVRQMRTASMAPASLDAALDGEDGTQLGETVEDEQADTPYEQLRDKAVTGMLRDMLSGLTEREALILNARYGLDGNPPRKLEEIGQDLGLSRERVRQVQKRALGKLRKGIGKIEGSGNLIGTDIVSRD